MERVASWSPSFFKFHYKYFGYFFSINQLLFATDRASMTGCR